eukprot:CAMPEP_0171322874 /NCGR_PEP_ID=MMETSP0816-20121228/115225_1 /TAXON_ID=420281 /ORGANISM="Proboscia inermis, Strain CCAP1064/1" /LENGTH=204 /DNA_ID=CAMNT_0011821449 /DNA_START=452 /DNA_END=1066 /DNA_ORIENTATION=-
MMARSITALIAFAASASAFAPQPQSKVASPTQLNAMSKSLPFLTAPSNLKGYVGAEAGFDPIGFSNWFDIKWLREAELKHCRAAMLATLGFVTTQFVTLPGLEAVADSNMAPTVVGPGPMLSIVAWGGIMEFWTNKGDVTMLKMFKDENRIPGNLGFDPLGLAVGKTDEEMAELELNELKNGRLAMLAIGGMIHHNWITGGALF